MRATIFLFTGILFVILSSHTVQGTIYCVSNEAQLLSALHDSATSSEDDVIQIVQGTYIGGFVYSSDNDSNISIEGGYTEGCASRFIDPTNTILDGNNTQRVLGVVNFATSGEFLFFLSGVTFQNGYIAGIGTGSGGAGLYMRRDNGNNFDVTLSKNEFKNNIAVSNGGGIYAHRIRDLIISNNEFNANYTDNNGGAIYSTTHLGSITISNSIFEVNAGGSPNAATIRIEHPATGDPIALVGNTITNSLDSGGIYINQSYYATRAPVTIEDNYIVGNDGGSGVRVSLAQPVSLINNVIAFNTVYDDFLGGGIDVESGDTIVLTNNTVSNNSSAGNGGGVRLSVTSQATILNLYNNIIWNNSANGQGDDLFIDNEYSSLIYADTELYNNDFNQSSSGFFIADPTFITRIDSSNLNNINPVFFNAMGGDFRLNSPSSCINAGNNSAPEISTTDIDGGPRIEQSTVDMGAYEYLNPLPPVALFSASHLAGSVPLTVVFTDESAGTVTEWAWTFGDGGTSIEQNPSHTYNSIGTYTVELTVTGSNGSDSEIKTNYINVTAPPEGVVADFSATPLSGNLPLMISFTDQSSGSIVSWAWDFDNNGSIDSTLQNPSYTYSSTGIYTVALTVTGSNGSDSEIKINYINVTDSPEAVVADFSATPLSGNSPLMVSFSDQSSGSIVSWAWDFDNNGSIDSTLQNPSYTYSSTGIYTVALTVTGSNGSDSETKSNYILVTDLSTDSDSDGIPDDWEIFYFKNLTTCDATSDFEKDGYTDLQEYFNMLNNETDPKGIQYHPKVINAPGGTGYKTPSSSDSFWQLMLPCIINGNQAKTNR